MKPEEWQTRLAIRLAVASRGALIGGQFRQSEHPTGCDPVRSTASMMQVAGLLTWATVTRRGVGKTEEGDVGRIQQACALGIVLALVGGDAQDPTSSRFARYS